MRPTPALWSGSGCSLFFCQTSIAKESFIKVWWRRRRICTIFAQRRRIIGAAIKKEDRRRRSRSMASPCSTRRRDARLWQTIVPLVFISLNLRPSLIGSFFLMGGFDRVRRRGPSDFGSRKSSLGVGVGDLKRRQMSVVFIHDDAFICSQLIRPRGLFDERRRERERERERESH